MKQGLESKWSDLPKKLCEILSKFPMAWLEYVQLKVVIGNRPCNEQGMCTSSYISNRLGHLPVFWFRDFSGIRDAELLAMLADRGYFTHAATCPALIIKLKSNSVFHRKNDQMEKNQTNEPKRQTRKPNQPKNPERKKETKILNCFYPLKLMYLTMILQ